MPIEGHSFAATLGDRQRPRSRRPSTTRCSAAGRSTTTGWMAVTWHKPGTDWNDDRWELYDQRTDYTQAWDLAAEQPEKLAELIELWWHEARRHNVLPLDDRGRDRFIDPTRPAASEDRDVYRYFPGTSPIPNPSLPDHSQLPALVHGADSGSTTPTTPASSCRTAAASRAGRCTSATAGSPTSTTTSNCRCPSCRPASCRSAGVCPCATSGIRARPGIGDVRLFVDDHLASLR